MSFLREKCDIWHSLGGALKVPQDKLHVISAHWKTDLDSMVEVCDAWLAQLREENLTPSWQILLSAVDEINAHELVAELEETKTDGMSVK